MTAMASLFARLFSYLTPSFLRRCFSFIRLHLLGRDATPQSLGPHLEYIIKDTKECCAAIGIEDKFRPSFAPSDGPVLATFISRGISYYYTTDVFIKRQPHADEMGLDINGNPVVIPYIADRLRNEGAALQFISKHTSIPVPKFLGVWEENGLVHLKTSIVRNGIELRNVNKALLPTAIERVTAQLESEIIPQLQQLRRNIVGSADPLLPVVVPHVLWKSKDTRIWPRITAETEEFVFVHTDLDRQNILVDPDTFRIVTILDWETAGFFPRHWELPKWKVEDRTPAKFHMVTEARKHQRALFGPEFESPEDD